jgi:hypothetical protein
VKQIWAYHTQRKVTTAIRALPGFQKTKAVGQKIEVAKIVLFPQNVSVSICIEGASTSPSNLIEKCKNGQVITIRDSNDTVRQENVGLAKRFRSIEESKANAFYENWSADDINSHLTKYFQPVFDYIRRFHPTLQEPYLWRLLCKTGSNRKLTLYARPPEDVEGSDIFEVRGKKRSWNEYIAYFGQLYIHTGGKMTHFCNFYAYTGLVVDLPHDVYSIGNWDAVPSQDLTQPEAGKGKSAANTLEDEQQDGETIDPSRSEEPELAESTSKKFGKRKLDGKPVVTPSRIQPPRTGKLQRCQQEPALAGMAADPPLSIESQGEGLDREAEATYVFDTELDGECENPDPIIKLTADRISSESWRRIDIQRWSFRCCLPDERAECIPHPSLR